VREDLGRFGEVVEVSVRADVPVRPSIPAPSTFVATARYASHAEAETCISALREEKRRAFCIYNETHYSCERGYPYSGWCSAEQGSAMMVAAHLDEAERKANHQGIQLPSRLLKAQNRRAKLTDISDGKAIRVEPSAPADEVLRQALEALEGAHFVGKGDRALVKQMAENFEWIMLKSTEQALANHASSGLTLPPEVLTEVLSKRETEVVREVLKLKDSPCSKLQTILHAALVASPLHRPRRRYSEMDAGSHVEMGRAEEDPETAEAPTSQHEADEVEPTETMSTASGERTSLSEGKQHSFSDHI